MAVKSIGIEAPVIREGDDLVKIVVDSVLSATKNGTIIEDSRALGREVNAYNLRNKDIIGVTESVVARAYGLYATVDDIADDIRKKFGDGSTICLTNMIYSRNRFSMILKGIARAAKKIIIVAELHDEVGNPRGVNQFTGVNIEEYYKEICQKENCEVEILHRLRTIWNDNPNLIYPGVDYIKEEIDGFIDCGLHLPNGLSGLGLHSWYCFNPVYTLADICSDKNPDYGVLGTNKSTEEKIKLFPTKEIANKFCAQVKAEIKDRTGVDVLVCVYGDGCFKDPVGCIWEFADPVTMPGYTNPEIFESTPNEIKLKAFADDKYKSLSGKELEKAIKGEIQKKDNNLVGNMASQGTTPRKIRDLVASLMDLTSGSGDKGTPIVWVQGYFENYATRLA